MDDVLVIGAGPAGLLAAWVARQRGARVRVLASGIGTTHIAPGWIEVLNETPGASLESWIAAHPEHPYALAGVDALAGGLAALREVCGPAGLSYVGAKPDRFRNLSGLAPTSGCRPRWARSSRRRSCRRALRPATCASPAPC